MALSDISDIGWSATPATAAVPGSSGYRGNTAATAASVGAGNTEALGQNLHVFMQALYQALSNTNTSATEAPHCGAPAGPTYTKAQPASPRSQGYQHTQGGLHGRIESLIGAFRHQDGSSSRAPSPSPSDGSLDGLQAAFNRLLQNLGTGSPAPPTADLTLHSWLQGLQQSVQQGTTRLSSIGSIIDVMA